MCVIRPASDVKWQEGAFANGGQPMNQFRNDGEMPPEIAARFPIVSQWQQDNTKPKTKQAPSTTSGESLLGYMISGVVNLMRFLLVSVVIELVVFLIFAMVAATIVWATGL
jgi:hypothetical protein